MLSLILVTRGFKSIDNLIVVEANSTKDLVEKIINESIMDEVKYIVCLNGEISKLVCKELEAQGKKIVGLNELGKHYKHIGYYVEFFNKIVRVAMEVLNCS